jgi:alpha-beta hydrolase superfamily lysophospholipase
MMKDFASTIETFTTISGGVEIHGCIHLPVKHPAPAIICSHGLFSDKDGSKFVALTQHLAEKGFVAVRYDHRGCGQSQGRLSDTTLTGRCADLAAVSDFMRRQTHYVNDRIGLMGSSMGGLVSLWEAVRNPIYHAVVTWATPWEISRPRNEQGKIGPIVLGDTFYTDLKQYRPAKLMKAIRRCMIVHGSADELVPLTHAHTFYRHLGEPKTIKVLDGADHRFSHRDHRRQAMNYTANFFEYHLMEP